ncbi:ATP-dependent RNA helicase DDX31/DBP7 [Mytilus galloprovincialis]|uniref:ATP-dependent RNA helicase n=2 Tax=Mytilus galloprovincialis TaxID=29158 RepID=A0A8B6GU57_MYTGA|nr:ATP-dependent RNA helicase DDX31/DBP7 [Mytilus galloprovincialis]
MSDIQLNLIQGPERNQESKTKPRGNRGQRIRARRQEKSRLLTESVKQSQNDSEYSKVTEYKEQTGTQSNQVQAARKRKHGELSPFIKEGGKPSGQVISSLFRFNPEIPKVKSLKVDFVKEDVFSSEHFRDLPLHPYMVSNLEEKIGHKTMTAVQKQTIPYIMQGRDVLVKSQTGSGKTLAFAVPIVQALQSISPKIQRVHGPYAIVIVPTRELATQSFNTFQKLVNPFTWIVPGCLMGGEKRKAEKARLRKGINILVATPGRLLDHLQHTDSLSMSKVRWLVLDEADRLLELGYEKGVADIINYLNEATTQRQTIMLSATLTGGVERLAGITLDDPVHVDISQSDLPKQSPDTGSKGNLGSKENTESKDSTESKFTLPQNLKQHFVITPPKLRLVTLAAFITWHCKIKSSKCKMIVFMSTQDLVEFHYDLFQHFFGVSDDPDDEMDGNSINILFFKLHGDMQQKDRTKAFQEFSQTDNGVLFCTDVAARGLDLPSIQWIVQYTTPGGATDYIHRVGRTARAGKQGQSLLFLMPTESEYIPILNKDNISLNEMEMKEVLKNLKSTVLQMSLDHSTKRSIPHTVEETATYLQMCFENYIFQNKSFGESAKKAFQSFVRAYSTYPSSLKHIFHIKNIHLGHLAKSFALREAPTSITVSHHGDQIKKWKEKKKQKELSRRETSGKLSEFSSGLSSGNIHKQKYLKKVKKTKLKRQ